MGVESRQDKRDESPPSDARTANCHNRFPRPASCIEANVSRCLSAGSFVPHRATGPPRAHVPSNEGNGRFQGRGFEEPLRVIGLAPVQVQDGMTRSPRQAPLAT